MHPSKFFEEVSCRIGIDVFEIFDSELNEKLKNIHPMNFIKSRFTLPVYEIVVEYDTATGNHKSAKKYMVLDSPGEEDDEIFSDMWAEMYMGDYISDKSIHNLKITDVIHVCTLYYLLGKVLPYVFIAFRK